MGYRDDTIERIKEKNSIWNNNLRELVNNEDGDSTEIKLLRQAMRLADLGDGLETPKKGPSFGQQKSRSGRQSPLKDDNQANRYTGGRGDTKIPIFNGAYQRPRSGLYERTDEFGTKTDPSKKLYFEQLKENITAIKNKEYEIPKKDGSSRAEGKLREIQQDDHEDRIELKQKENILLRKVQSQKETIYEIDEKLSDLQVENRSIIEQNIKMKNRMEQLERELEGERRSSARAKQSYEDGLRKSQNESRSQCESLAQANRKLEKDLKHSREAIKDLTIKLVMCRRDNNVKSEKIDQLQSMYRYLENELSAVGRRSHLVGETEYADDLAEDSTEALLDSTTARLLYPLPKPRKVYHFTCQTDFRLLSARSKWRVLFLAVRFLNHLTRLHNKDANFREQLFRVLK